MDDKTLVKSEDIISDEDLGMFARHIVSSIHDKFGDFVLESFDKAKALLSSNAWTHCHVHMANASELSGFVVGYALFAHVISGDPSKSDPNHSIWNDVKLGNCLQSVTNTTYIETTLRVIARGMMLLTSDANVDTINIKAREQDGHIHVPTTANPLMHGFVLSAKSGTSENAEAADESTSWVDFGCILTISVFVKLWQISTDTTTFSMNVAGQSGQFSINERMSRLWENVDSSTRLEMSTSRFEKLVNELVDILKPMVRKRSTPVRNGLINWIIGNSNEYLEVTPLMFSKLNDIALKSDHLKEHIPAFLQDVHLHA